jgi:hypothetical protein
MTRDKQLRGIRLASVLKKRQLDQALNAKEFAVLAGISYSVAREWFGIKGFPRVQGVVFWQDFVQWRNQQNGNRPFPQSSAAAISSLEPIRPKIAGLPQRAAKILHDIVN